MRNETAYPAQRGGRYDTRSGRRQDARERRGEKSFFFRKKICKFCADKASGIDYKDVLRLQKFITEKGKILPSRISGNCAPHQRSLARAIKFARAIALLPYTAE